MTVNNGFSQRVNNVNGASGTQRSVSRKEDPDLVFKQALGKIPPVRKSSKPSLYDASKMNATMLAEMFMNQAKAKAGVGYAVPVGLPVESLSEALSEATKLENTGERQEAVQKYLEALSHSGNLDINGDGVADAEDMFLVYSEGKYPPNQFVWETD